ncbi:hypothetical protein M9Y10_033865 [Tritrichomonas musculus]|uniref:non-specific serine/threonine protein kinase n=1 Tax=Tritrichomonas musculus TaxID=1915356 RepID=A0ABR2KDC9_9EUKA
MFKHEYDICESLGDGNYGRSSKCTHPKIQDDLVMQEISLSNLAKSEKEDILDEFTLISALSHPNIVQYRSCFLDKNTLCIVSDFVEGTSLSDKIQSARNSLIDEDTILNWFVQICYAIKYIHDHRILHRNIHPSNIILTRYGTVKINGFMFAKILDHSSEFPSANYGTPYNMCPETCLGLQYTPKSDIWSLGILLYQLCTLRCSKGFNPLISSSLLIKNSKSDDNSNNISNIEITETQGNGIADNSNKIDVATNKNGNDIDVVPVKVSDEQNNALSPEANDNLNSSPNIISGMNGEEDEVDIPDMYSNDLRCLIRSMINKDQSLRPSINQILQLDFLRDRMESILKTFLNRLELSTPSSGRSSHNGRNSNGRQRPNLGRNVNDNSKKEIAQRFSNKKKPPITQPKQANMKKIKKRPNEGENGVISNPSIAAVGAAGVPVETLSINAVSIDPSSFIVHKEKPKYDVMQTRNSSEISPMQSYEDFSSQLSMGSVPSSASSSTLSSIASKEEFYDMRRKEIKKRQKEKELERQKKMEELAQEAKKRKKELGQMEAPFKKIREISEAAKKSESSEEFLYFALETAKPPPVGHVIHRSFSAKDRERETNLIAELINQKRDEVQTMKKRMMQQHDDDDVIMIGNVEVAVDKPKYPQKKQSSGASTNRSRINAQPLVDIPLKENNDLLLISAISKTAINLPPSDEEQPIKNSKSSHETGLFYFNGLPIDIPGVDICTALERADCLIQFITQGLGQDHFDQAKKFVFDISSPSEENKIKDDEANQMFKDIFSNNEEMKYFPYVQHLIFCENYV